MLYRDSLDNLQPYAAITQFGGNYGKGGYLCLHTTAVNNPHDRKRWDNTPEAIATIAAWAEENGYDIAEGKDGYGAYKAELVHRETAAALAEQRTKAEAVFAGAEPGYIRFGNLPDGGRSRNRATGNLESGVSVFKAEFARGGHWRPILDTPQQIASFYFLIADDRPIYRVYGKRVGTGGDGEPVLKVERIELILGSEDEHEY